MGLIRAESTFNIALSTKYSRRNTPCVYCECGRTTNEADSEAVAGHYSELNGAVPVYAGPMTI